VTDDRTGPDHAPSRDPRLEIPQALRDPVRHASLDPKKPSVMSGSIGEVGTALAIGIDFLVIVAAGGGLGWLADRQFGWGPAGVIVGSVVGMAAGLGRLIHRLSKEDQKAGGNARPGAKK
jgi:F0F1-type ATP synthase assembly protein I